MTSIDQQNILDEQLVKACCHYDQNMTLPIIKELIDNGANVNYVDDRGRNALNMSKLFMNYDIFKLLIENGVNIDQQDEHGDTISMRVISESYNEKWLELLLESGVNINIKNNKGFTLLMWAKSFQERTVIFRKITTKKIELLEEHIFQKKLALVQKRLTLGKLFMSYLGKNLLEEGLYEHISLEILKGH